MVMKWKRLHKEAQAPERQTPGSAGYDLCACIQDPAVIGPGDTGVFPTGLALEIPEGHVGLVFCRSGLGVKHGISLPNCVGVIDSDYRGELVVPLRNFGDKPYTVQPGADCPAGHRPRGAAPAGGGQGALFHPAGDGRLRQYRAVSVPGPYLVPFPRRDGTYTGNFVFLHLCKLTG